MASRNTRTTRNVRRSKSVSYPKPSSKALGLNKRLTNGNILVALFGHTNKAAKAIVSVICQKGTNRMYLNIRSKSRGVAPFSKAVDQLYRPKGMTITRLAFTASLTGHVFVAKPAAK